ncbi:MAG TPA: SPOR domain-containing protein [Burkholderiales bacterium]|nr:SPOR domain-containing protein [Burkholderiales bacterium]
MRLKTRARQRLIGAVVLLIATAIILPMLLDKSPRPLNSDVVIDMPEAKAPPAKPPVKIAAVPVQKLPVPAVVPSPDHAVPPVTPVPPVTAPIARHTAVKDVHTDSADHKKSEKSADTKKIARAADKLKPMHSVSPAAVGHSAQPPADAKPAAIRAANDHTRYVVQLGAFSSAANVRQLCDRLKKAGVATYTEILPSGSTRVRAGPFSSYELADKTLAKISMAGIQAQIVPLSH